MAKSKIRSSNDSLQHTPIVLDETTVSSFREGRSQTSWKLHNDTEERKQQLRGLHKWGIPFRVCDEEAPEVLLLARIVWIRYHYPGQKRLEAYPWPAIYYKSYREIAHYAPAIWSELGFFRRLPLAASMVFDSSNPKNKSPVARLLGKVNLELIEIAADKTCEFYWELPTLLPKIACNIDYFAQDPALYFDWHRALDEVERILRECLGNQYVLTTEPSLKSWHERARDAELKRWSSALKPAALLTTCYTTCGPGACKNGDDDLEEFDIDLDDLVTY